MGAPTDPPPPATTPGTVRFAPTPDPHHPTTGSIPNNPKQHLPGGGPGPSLGQQLDPTSATYASLVQSYLSVLCHTNATFLAERMVSYRPTDVAVYLLATCHYRSGQVRRARAVLLEYGVGSNGNNGGIGTNDGGMVFSDGGGGAGDFIPPSSSAADNDAIPSAGSPPSTYGFNAPISSAATYLLSRCCTDLRLYAEAEDVLLRPVRESYRTHHQLGTGTGTGGPNHPNAANNDTSGVVPPPPGGSDMDEYILTTTPCPVPNGAAGLALLGDICRRSNRKGRAVTYYRMSLKLDPMMWTSYESLCEMGAADDVDDPTKVFGVIPPALRHEDVRTAYAHPHAQAAASGTPASFVSFGAASTPGGGAGGATPMSLDAAEDGAAAAGDSSSSLLQATSLFQSSGRAGGGGGAGGRGGRGGGRGSQRLLFETPDLTPIQKQQQQPPLPNPYSAASATAPTPTTNAVLDRARTVASRLYYEPSPETTPPHALIGASPAPPSIKKSWSAAKSADRGRSGGRGGQRRSRLLGGLGAEAGGTTAAAAAATARPKAGSRGRLSFGSASASSSVQTPLGERALFAAEEEEDGVGTNSSQPLGQGQTDAGVRGEEDARGTSAPVVGSGGDFDVDGGQCEEEEEGGSGEDGGVQEILELLCVLGAAQRRLCQYKCRDALRIFQTLPPSQYQTGWVQHQVGRAYFEMSDYQNAQRSLETMQHLEPHRMAGLEVLSTTLWHLKKEVELSNLAQRAVDFDRTAPESWCVVGNTFSLQKEHETALTFFRRSVQLDPTFTYSHTLSGHEYVANEDFDKAVSCYRDAIRVDDRHYNAWYGLGAIYFRQEKHDLAEYHFRRALDINPQSSVLHCHLGMAQHANGRASEALETLAGAFRLDPRNPQARYQRATIWMSMDRPEEALSELEKVRDAAPREASVHFAMGRVLKRLGRPEKAMRCFLTALDLDPKDNNLIKSAMDRLDEPDVDEDVSAF